MRATSATVLTVGALLVVTACSDPQGGSPTTAPPATTTTTTEPSVTTSNDSTSGSPATLPFAGAPKVTDPLATEKFQRAPCGAFTAEQTAQLRVGSQGEQRESSLGMACSWTGDGSARVDLIWADDDPNGLSSVYRANSQGKYKYFVPQPAVDGYPAVAHGSRDERSKGTCMVTVGVTDKVTYSIALWQSQAKIGTVDPCTVATEVAGMALKTMKAGA